MENTYNTSDHKPRDEDLRGTLEEGRLGYNTPKETARVVVVEIDK